MKQTFLKFAGKKLIAATFISASVLFSSFSASAATNNSIIEILSGDNSSVQFTGSTSDALLFKVHINNDKADNFTLTIKSEDGNVLFAKSFNTIDFDKQIKILKGEEEGNRYYITVSSSNKSLENTFVVNSEVRTVNDVTINKL